MTYSDDEYLMISGLQHFSFCRRQWALIHVEQQWKDNILTVEGNLLHSRAHSEQIKERRGSKLIVRGLRVSSKVLGVSGICDVVEFYREDHGAKLNGERGSWRPYPVEYKRGTTKINNADRLQLCAQAMCLEEMLGCQVEEGALYYGQSRRRERVLFTESIREEVRQMLLEMHSYFSRGITPKVKQGDHCNACSLKDICLPSLSKRLSVTNYVLRHVQED